MGPEASEDTLLMSNREFSNDFQVTKSIISFKLIVVNDFLFHIFTDHRRSTFCKRHSTLDSIRPTDFKAAKEQVPISWLRD